MRRAFTLVEVCVVIFLVAAVAATVTLRMGPALGRVKMKDVTQRIADFDRNMRTAACEQDRTLQLVADLNAGRLKLADADGKELDVPALELPDGFWFGRFLVRDQDLERGTAVISCSRAGLTPSYAVRLHGPSGERKWLFFCGLTGNGPQDMGSDERDEKNIRDILASVAPRDDAR